MASYLTAKAILAGLVILSSQCPTSSATLMEQITGRPAQHREEHTASDMLARISRSLVVILTEDEHGPVAQGSGFFLGPGIVATNLHVLKRASQGFIKSIGSPSTYRIEAVVGIDLNHDLCVFRVDASAPPLALATGDARTGDDVYVAGSPLGMEGSFSRGIVSAIRPEAGLIQVDAAISPGSSGGPILNSQGEVVAVATSTLVQGQNLNFGVPVADLRHLASVGQAGSSTTIAGPLTVSAAGVLAVSDLENGDLRGPVRSVTSKAVVHFPRPDGSFEDRQSFVVTKMYDGKGRLVEITDSHSRSAVWSRRFDYGDDGLPSRSWHSSGGSGWVEERRPALPDVIEAKLQDMHPPTVEIQTFTYHYDDGTGRQAERTGSKTVRRKFNTNGWLVEEEEVSDPISDLDSVIRYDYLVDDRGNWLRQDQIVIETQYNMMTTYRDITYY